MLSLDSYLCIISIIYVNSGEDNVRSAYANDDNIRQYYYYYYHFQLLSLQRPVDLDKNVRL